MPLRGEQKQPAARWFGPTPIKAEFAFEVEVDDMGGLITKPSFIVHAADQEDARTKTQARFGHVPVTIERIECIGAIR